MNNPVRVVAAVIRRDNRFLVCERPIEKRHGGLWEFPGGKCEPNESDAEAIRRELSEELAVMTVSVGKTLITIADHGSPFEIVFIDVLINGEPRAVEHTALMWASVPELVQMPLAPSDRIFVQHLTSLE